MRQRPKLALAALAAAIALPAAAQEVERYRLERTQDGYVRLDTATGRMTLCREASGQLVCTLAAEEREAYDRDIDALRDRVKALEDRLTALEAQRPETELPSEEEFEQTMGYMERFFRRFMGIIQDFEREDGREKPAEPGADRT